MMEYLHLACSVWLVKDLEDTAMVLISQSLSVALLTRSLFQCLMFFFLMASVLIIPTIAISYIKPLGIETGKSYKLD